MYITNGSENFFMSAVVIGAGFGGLTAAALLARDGIEVTVLEKNEQPGGRARVYSEEGYSFDMGPSWYLMPDVFEKLFSEFDKKPGDFYDLIRVDPSYRIFFNDGSVTDVSASLEENYELFESFEEGGGEKLRSYLEKAGKHYKLAMDELIYREYESILDIVSGRLLLEDKHRLARAPDGHGGALKALVASGALADMQTRGVEIISYFQVDNPLVKLFDPLFIGLHAKSGSEMSSKVVPKADDHERVGNMCLHDGRAVVVEYTDFPDELATARNPDGSRRFDAGNIAIHLLDVGFVDRVIAQRFALPYHRAEKRVAWLDEKGVVRSPKKPNAVKLETFVFDALPLARHALVLQVDRAEEFSPVKNTTGVDSLDTAVRDQIRRAARWLAAAGVEIPCTPDGELDLTLEIAPSYALDAEDVKQRMRQPTALKRGKSAYLF